MSGKSIGEGVYRDKYGYEIRWQDAGQTRTKHFPPDTPLKVVKAQRDERVKQARPARSQEGSFGRDAVRVLSDRKGKPSYKADRSHMRPWIHRFRGRARWAITKEMIQKALRDWQEEGYNAWTLRHRRRVIRLVYMELDGEAGPVAGVTVPSPPRARKQTVSDELILGVALNLKKQETKGIGRLHSAKTRARFLVLVLTGMRPAQLRRALRVDINLDTRFWVVQPAKGDRGTVLYLNDEQLAAAKLFIAADAFGHYDTRSFARTLQRNGWPKGIRPYNVRHSIGRALRRSGVPLKEIADHFGHLSADTTSEFYVDPELEQLRALSERINGRLGAGAAIALAPPVVAEDRSRPRKQ